jgi:hypothetical protein
MSTQPVNSGFRRQDLYRLLVVGGFGLVLGIAGTLALRQIGAPSPAGATTSSGAPAAAAFALAAPSPQPSPSPTPDASPTAPPSPSSTPSPTPKPTPKPSLGPVDLNLAPNGNAVFSSQITKEMCAPAGMTSALAIMHLVKASNAVQRQIESRIHGWTTYADSHNGGWGPLAMTKALAAYGAPGYVVKTFKTRDTALRAAGIALSATREPVVLLAWWGAHTWVMSGYRATGNLALDPKATFTGAYIVDPWYPRVSSIWGHVNPPGHFYNMAGMRRNYIAWTRPEGRYPGRDGRWVVVLPTKALRAVNG